MPLQIDLKKLEARVAGAVVEDLHIKTAMRMFNCSANEVTLQQRKLAKLYNYFEIYGGTEHAKIL